MSWTIAKRALILGIAFVGAYVLCYLGYRETHRQRWAFDGRDFVIFESRMSDYAFRPLSHLDPSITGVRTHIGPHR